MITLNFQEAVNRASNSNQAAKNARTKKIVLDFTREILDCWKAIFMNSPVGILTFLFVFSILMEVIYSFPMYMDLMSVMMGRGYFLLALIGALFIVSWGAYSSHLIAKKMSRSVFNFNVYNEEKFSQKTIPHVATEEKVQIATRYDFIKGLFVGILLLIVVTIISWQRLLLMTTITSLDYSLMHKLIPVVCVFVEIISGIYLNYLYRKFNELRKAKRLFKEFLREKNTCIYETRIAHEYYQKAIDLDEKMSYNKDLYDANYRYQYRSQDDDDYCEPIPLQKFLSVTVSNESGLVSGAHLAAILSNREYCNSIYTNEQGEGILTWDSETKEVLKVFVNNEEYRGPYRQNSKIRIDLRKMKKIENV